MKSIYNLTEFGKFLKKLRKTGGLTQVDIKEINGINPKTIRSIEYGETTPSLDTLEKLGDIYKVDLVKSLESFRYDNNEVITKLYREIDFLSLNDDIDTLRSRLTEIRSMVYHPTTQSNQFINDKLKQLHYLAELANIRNNLDQTSLRLTEAYCLEALRITHPKFTTKNLEKNYLDLLELRILISLSFCSFRLDRKTESLELINSIIKMTISLTKVNSEAFTLLIHAYFAKSYILFLLNEHEEVINICNEAIKLSQIKYITKLLPNIYFRKGISEFKLSNSNYTNSLKSSIQTLDILNMTDLKEKYIKILRDNYHIELS